jgi:hypothetical protein
MITVKPERESRACRASARPKMTNAKSITVLVSLARERRKEIESLLLLLLMPT